MDTPPQEPAPASSRGITVQFRFTRTHAYLALAVVLAAIVWPAYAYYRTPRPGSLDPVQYAPLNRAVLGGKILTEPVTIRDTTRFTLAVAHVLNREAAGLIQVSTTHPGLRRGDEVTVVGDLRQVQAGGFGDYLRNRGIFSTVRAERITVQEAAPAVPFVGSGPGSSAPSSPAPTGSSD